MAQMDEQEFKFPDEIEENKAPKAEAEDAGFEIEVEMTRQKKTAAGSQCPSSWSRTWRKTS